MERISIWRCYFAVSVFSAGVGLANIASPNYFCADMNPQLHVIIDQLMGMWYGVEIINHQEESHYKRSVHSCPIIHLSEDKTPSTTINPLYKNYNYGHNYGEGHGYVTSGDPYGKVQQDINRQIQEQSEYDRKTTYRNYPESRRLHHDRTKHNHEIRYLRLYWDENGESTEYHLRCNKSQPGFWISSGPENGAYLEPQFGHFAGTVQVIKAVGTHLVLTFCHQLPKRQLFTILLSREAKLDPGDIYGVHNLLNRKGLGTNAVKKVCNSSADRSTWSLSFIVVLILSVVCKTLKSDLC